MCRRKRVFALVLAASMPLVATAPEARADDPAARQLMEEALEALPTSSFKAKVKLSGDYRSDRELAVQHKLVEGARSTYIEVVSPDFLAGMRFLFREQVGRPPKQHMRYIASKMPVLIANDTRAEPFLGSTFSLVDLVEPDLESYTFEFVGADTANGRKCKLVQATPDDAGKSIYSKGIHCIDPETLVVVRRKLFDPKGKAAKEWTGSRIEKIEGNWTVLDQRMKDLQRDVETRMEIVQIDYGVEIPDATFTTEYLTR